MDIRHDFRLVHVHHAEHSIEVFQRFCHDDYIIGKTKVIDVFAIDVDAESVPFQELENVLQRVREQFRTNNVSLSHAFLQLEWFRALFLKSDGHGDVTIQTLQHFDIPIVDMTSLEGLQYCPGFD